MLIGLGVVAWPMLAPASTPTLAGRVSYLFAVWAVLIVALFALQSRGEECA